MSTPKSVEGFEVFEFADSGMSHAVYIRGSGPGVLLMHELPGMVPQCVELATLIANRGFTVFMPLMFGEADAPPSTMRLALRVCLSREFHCFAHRESSPITRWLRNLCTLRIRPRCPGPGIGAIGMCFSGSFVLSLFVNDQLLAPILCQPGLPFPSLKPGAGAALAVSPEDLQSALASPSPILGFRFAGDKICPAQRFETLRSTFGPRFEGHELAGTEHSVMTLSFVNDPAHPTFQARERLFAFLHERLKVPPPDGGTTS